MLKAVLVTVVVLAAGQASALQCQDKGAGYYDCDDGSFGNSQGDTLYLSRPDPSSAYGERREQQYHCDRDETGALRC